MSELSEAMERAEKRLASMTPEQRQKLHVIVLQEELRRAPAISPRHKRKG